MDKLQPSKIHSFDLLSSSFKQFRPVYPFPLEWNPKTQSFFTLGVDHPNYKRFHLVVNLVMSFISPICIFLILRNQERFKQEGVVFASVMLPMLFFCVGLAKLTGSHLDEIISAFRNMGVILREIERSLDVVRNRKRGQKEDREWEKITACLTHSLRWINLGTPVVLPTCLLYLHLDMYYSLDVVFLKPNSVFRWVSIPMRYCCCVLTVGEGWRIYTLFIGILLCWLEMQSKYFGILKGKVGQKEFVRWYVKGQLAAKIMEECINQWMGIALLALFGVVTMCSVYSIKYFGKIPFLIYWFIPLKAGFDGVILYLAFLFMVGVYEVTGEMLEEAKLQGASNGRIAKKELKALHPISVKCGRSFLLKRKTKSTFYSAVVGRTVEGILIDD